MVAVSLPCFPQTNVSNIVVIIVFVVNDGGGNMVMEYGKEISLVKTVKDSVLLMKMELTFQRIF